MYVFKGVYVLLFDCLCFWHFYSWLFLTVEACVNIWVNLFIIETLFYSGCVSVLCVMILCACVKFLYVYVRIFCTTFFCSYFWFLEFIGICVCVFLCNVWFWSLLLFVLFTVWVSIWICMNIYVSLLLVVNDSFYFFR